MGQQIYTGIRLFYDFFSTKEVKKLKNLENGDTYTIIYLKMQLKALKNGGYLFFDGIMETFAEEIALDIDENTDDVKMAIDFLKQFGLIEETSEDKSYKINKVTNGKRARGTAEYQNWRKSVYERDNYTCQSCGKKGVTLNAHHIKAWKLFPKLRYDISNGVTLCEKCHKDYHKKFGLGDRYVRG